MRNPIRRSKNIGTSKQGHGQNNKLIIPQPAGTSKSFFERLTTYHKESKNINEVNFTFVVEQTRKGSQHACTISDVVEIVKHIPSSDYKNLSLIVFRQPKRKEELISPVWGRLIYSYEFEGKNCPAIILESVDLNRSFKLPKNLSPEELKELDRLKRDGHPIKEDKRYYKSSYFLENVRNTQLYRTLLHEFGHYKHYLQEVELPGEDGEEYEEWERRFDAYFKISNNQKEQFAHSYSEKLFAYLTEQNVIPFEKIVD